ncbi:ionotropic receptor 25a-like [Bacillus rossius redtenbacheri]|uniref:ionotropic receptor 25a-like n=1 Tax=Bacillus rossius redtenbacheri TaxID=93214 RepID=UPI002FDD8222
MFFHHIVLFLARLASFLNDNGVESVAWSYRRPDEEGRPQWEGYCVDLLEQLAASMSFHYELVVAEGGPGARRPDGTWDGVLGDLVDGKTDIIIAPLSVTSEREDVIDFVTPYFEKSGISIVIRKPARKTSLFKFMTVLKLEVWLSILASLAITSLMLWLLDRCSPYSYRNNKARLPRPCRDFTLTESLWFAMTSITPQGGGEAPRALSGRTLVAAYWLFVVLVLATFTANLAAFLTVERMESPVSSLEQLGRQSRISYTVVNNSDTHEYFRNMKNAEYILHNVWKEMALNASSNPSQYRVWDYPIKEQYENILLAITETGPVENETVGFQKVLDDEESEFAFIHDSARIRHEVTLNCLLAEVGDVFAERELAIAVQQGSHLYAEISGRILELQKNLYFEGLTEKYWNSTKKRSCSNNNQSEGITLESLGGIFIAMVFGLVLAMITLSGEIFYYQKRHNSEVTTLKTNFRDNSTSKNDILKMEFPTKTIHGNQQAFHISVFPKNHFY